MASGQDGGDPDRAGEGTWNPHLLSARSAQRLSSILIEIKAMYVVGLNAQLAVGRAGEAAAGFERISARLNDLAGEISDLIGKANRQAARVSRLTYKAHVGLQAFRPLESLEGDRKRVASRERLDQLLAEETEEIRSLMTALKALEERIEAAEHLSINARVEASKVRSPEARAQFNEVVERVQQSINKIHLALDEVRPWLEALQAREGAAA